MLKLTQKIAGAGSELDKTDQVEWSSVKKSEILTKEPDLLTFRIRNYGSKTWRPDLNDEIYLYDTDGTTRIFGGVVVDIKDTAIALVSYIEVACKDFTHTLDRKLVSKTYASMTGTAIVADIISSFTSGFTTTNVSCAVTLDKVSFNYSTVSKTLQKLADTLGNYEWYVDYNKDVHFFQKDSRTAPFQIDDTSGNSVWDSLEIKTNTSQLRNKITIRGGLAIGSTFTDNKIADGKQRTFFVGYDIESLTVDKALAATPTTFVSQTIGKDGVDPETSFNVLYNPNNGLIRFPAASIPAVNDVVKWSGTPRFPLVSETNELASQASYGIFEFLIIDKTILTKNAAKQRANAELARYSQPIKTVTFRTDLGGLNTGETITVNSPLRSINENFIITRIDVVCKTPTSYTYNVEATTQLTVSGIIDLMSSMLSNRETDQIQIDANEVIDRLQSVNEEITLTETFTISKGMDQFETMTLTEVVTPQALDYPVQFCVGNFLYGIINPQMDSIPPYVADTNTFARFVNGQAAGSTTDSTWGWGLSKVSGTATATVRFEVVGGRCGITMDCGGIVRAGGGTTTDQVLIGNAPEYSGGTISATSLQYLLPVVAGLSYVISGDVYIHSNSGCSVAVTYVFYNAAGTRLTSGGGGAGVNNATLNTWQSITPVGFTAPTNAVYMHVSGRIQASSPDAVGKTMKATFTNIQVTPSPSEYRRQFILDGSPLA